MLSNYLKIALRRMRREKTYAAISILSLAVGLAVSLLIGLNIYHELSWDDFHEKADRIYRVADRVGQGENTLDTVIPPMPLGPAMVAEFPEVERAVRIVEIDAVTSGKDRRYEERLLAVDSTFFEMFSFPLRSGDRDAVLRDPTSAVLSAEAAGRLFGETDPIGASLTVRIEGEERVLTVDGVTEPLPTNSTVQFDLLMTMEGYAQGVERYGSGSWLGGGQVVTYVELRRAESAGQVEARLPEFARSRMSERQAKMHTFSLEPLTEVHFRPGYFGALGTARPMSYLYLLAGIALLVLLIAGINFVTISLARSSDRYREVGIRKTVGARRDQIAGQFWGETLLTTLLGFALAVPTAVLALPLFNRLLGKELTFGLMGEPDMLIGAVLLLVVLGLLAGSYPALVLSRPSPIRVFYGRSGGEGSPAVVRGLLVLQLALGAALVAGVFIMNKQLAFMRSHDPGYQPEQLIRVDLPWGSQDRAGRRFAEVAETLPEVASAATQYRQLVGEEVPLGGNDVPLTLNGRKIRVHHTGVATRFPETAGLRLVRGRTFRPAEKRSESVSALVNESFVEAYELEDPIGMEAPGHRIHQFDRFRIVGVVEDFHFRSLRHQIEPLVLFHAPNSPARVVYVRSSTTDLGGTIASLRSAFEEVAPGLPFEYHFVDDLQDHQYRTEERWANLVLWASAIGLGLAGAGLFGLALMAARRREKEISIRKVLGATVTAIVGLFSRDFLKMAVLGVLIGLPAAYVVFDRWLSEFAYRADLGAFPFVGAALCTLLLVWISVSYQSIRAALVNPAETLRNH